MKGNYDTNYCDCIAEGETKNCYYIFDYYKGDLPTLDKSKGVIMLSAQKISLILWAISTMFISYDV